MKPAKPDTLCSGLHRAFEKRAALVQEAGAEGCLRVVHSEIDGIVVDQFGPCIWVYWYRAEDPTALDLEQVDRFARAVGKTWLIRRMRDRGHDPNSRISWHAETFPSAWIAREGTFRFRLNRDLGLSPGLFLDQRNNRLRVATLSAQRKVLNLFSYTGAFAVAALAGGAHKVINVDVSKTYLEWGKLNLAENALDLDRSLHFALDAATFTSGAVKRNESFDLIICDPPTFGRARGKVFRVAADLPRLVLSLWDSLAPGGTLFVSTNSSSWSESDFRLDVLGRLPRGLYRLLPETPPLPDFRGGAKLNTLWLRKN